MSTLRKNDMSLLETLTSQISGKALEGLASQLGADSGTTSSAISAALPMIVGALARNASSKDGAASLANALDKDHDGGIMDNLTDFLGSSDNGPGGAILGHVFGNKRTGVEAGLSQMTGLSTGQAGSLLENLAPIVMGQLGRQKKSSGLGIEDLAGLLAGESNTARSQSGGAMDLLSSLLDQDGDGSMLDDIGGMLGKFLK